MYKPYCCDGSRKTFEQYYTGQAGGALPIFIGARGQSGHGFANVLGGLFRSALPMLKRIGGQALRTGTQILGDMASGKKFSDVALQRIGEGINTFIPSETSTQQSGGGRRRRYKRKRAVGKRSRNKPKRVRATRKKRVRSKRRKLDIFS